MKVLLKKKIILILFILLIIVYPNIVHAETEESEDGKDIGIYTTDSNVKVIEEGINNQVDTFTVKAQDGKKICVDDTIHLKYHIRGQSNIDNFNKASSFVWDEKQMEVYKQSLEINKNFVNEMDVKIDIKPLEGGDITLEIKNFYLSYTARINIKNVQPNLEKELRKTWGSEYCEVKLYNLDKDEKLERVIKGQYSEGNYDTSKQENAREAIYSYSKMTSDTNWGSTYQNEQLPNGVKYRKFEVECTAVKDYGIAIHKGEVYTCNYEVFYNPETNKLLYHYARNIKTLANGENSSAGTDNTERFDGTSDKTIESIKKYIATTDPGQERTEVEFKDVLTDLDTFVPGKKASDGKIEKKMSVILSVITSIGMILAVVMCAVLGLKYMLGSVEDKAEYKKDMIPYFIGAGLLFGITAFVKILQQLGESINNI